MTENKIVRYFYIILGLILAILSIFLIIWFFSDILYLFQNSASSLSLERTFAVLVTLYFAIFYLLLGFKPEKISKASNLSIIALILALIVYFVISIFFTCGSIGGTCPAYLAQGQKLLSPVLLLCILAAFILSIVSPFFSPQK